MRSGVVAEQQRPRGEVEHLLRLLRGERRDSNPRPPGPQPDGGGSAEVGFRIPVRFLCPWVPLGFAHIGPQIGPLSERTVDELIVAASWLRVGIVSFRSARAIAWQARGGRRARLLRGRSSRLLGAARRYRVAPKGVAASGCPETSPFRPRRECRAAGPGRSLRRECRRDVRPRDGAFGVAQQFRNGCPPPTCLEPVRAA
jgi:hypothetical protein